MAEYIEREAALSKLADLADTVGEADECTEETIKVCMRALRTIPATDVAPVGHGRWKYIYGDEFSETYKCDKCGREFDICVELYRETLPTYCPSCGAKMDGGKEDEAD